MGLTEQLLNEAIKDLQIEQMALSQEIGQYTVPNTPLVKKQKDKRASLIKQMGALNQFIRDILKYQKVQNDFITTVEEQAEGA
jgi:hypothetical protein